jgi:hypothetical protein
MTAPSHADSAVRELLDKQALYELVTRYCRAIDRCDEELLRSCYHPEAIDEHGNFNGNVEGFIEYFRADGGALDPTRRPGPMQHCLTNTRFEIDGDSAHGETYFESREVRDGSVRRGMGRYIDRYERRNGDWRIAHRRVILEHHERAGLDPSQFIQGTRDRNDPSYDRTPVVSHG